MKKLTVHNRMQPTSTVEVQEDFYAVVKGHVWHLYHGEPVLLYTEKGKVVVKSLVSMLAKFHKQDPSWAHTAEPNRYTKETLRTEQPRGLTRNKLQYRANCTVDKVRQYRYVNSVQEGVDWIRSQLD